MLDFIFRVRAAMAYRRLTGYRGFGAVPWPHAWDMAGSLVEWRKDGYSPIDAVREDLSYWAD